MGRLGGSLSPVEDFKDLDADVVIVGYGPVGQTLAAMLGRAGHRVIVLERREGRYETPRAGHFDHEIMRIFQSIGIAEEVAKVASPAVSYEFIDPDGTVISRLPRAWDAASGWDASYHFYQPELEDVLDHAVQRVSAVDVRFRQNVVGMNQADERVEIMLEDGSTVTARYAVGADGANSAVRALSGIPSTDLGFRADWLVVDVRRRPGSVPLDIPDTGQVLNPDRPNHLARISDKYYRWEFMLVEGDDRAEMVTPQRIWELLAPWIGPEDGEVIRQTVYTFRSIVADTFRDRNVLLAGDAAHVMPPFLGQGMCSGIRDASALAWMLDFVLRDISEPALLDLYSATRRAHVEAYIEESVRIGKIVCETDPILSAAHREAMRAATALPPPFEPLIGGGFRTGDPLAGALGVQPTLHGPDDLPHRSDDVLGNGFTLLCIIDLDDETRRRAAQLEKEIGLRVLTIGPVGAKEEGTIFLDWLTKADVVAVLVRPDFYVFGSASLPSDVAGLLDSLRLSLSLAVPSGA